jgi:hypothetical protein
MRDEKPKPLTLDELREQRGKLAGKLEAAIREIAVSRIAEEERKRVASEASRIRAGQKVLISLHDARAKELEALVKAEPENPGKEPLFFGRSAWEAKKEAWEKWDKEVDKLREYAHGYWQEAGGRFDSEGKPIARKEVEYRAGDTYVMPEARRLVAESEDWKAEQKDIEAKARIEAERDNPETRKALDEADRRIAALEYEAKPYQEKLALKLWAVETRHELPYRTEFHRDGDPEGTWSGKLLDIVEVEGKHTALLRTGHSQVMVFDVRPESAGKAGPHIGTTVTFHHSGGTVDRMWDEAETREKERGKGHGR